MHLKTLIEKEPFILTEAGVIEALSHDTTLPMHPQLDHSLLIYDEKGREALARLYTNFINVAYKADLPVLITTPTWRANHGRLSEFGIKKNVDADAARFSLSLREKFKDHASKIFIGGLIGCKNDCYQACEALTTKEAEKAHAPQINQLAASKLDFLMAATLPSVREATGIAMAMSKTPLPYFISFVIDKNGLIFDGTELESAIKHIDSKTKHHPPIAYFVNCAYPSFLHPEKLSAFVLTRLKGFQGNASSKNHSELDGSDISHSDSIEDWGERMIALNRLYGIPILGGCCGTRVQHLEYIVKGIKNTSIDE